MWLDEKHKCELPEYYYGRRIGRYWECDHCKRQWQVLAEAGPDEYGRYHIIRYISVGDSIEYKEFKHGDLSQNSNAVQA